jgi:alanyl-tRNA synthetase
MAKKNFKEDIQGADKLFSANDKTEIENFENNSSDNNVNVLINTLTNTKINILDNILTNIKEEPKGKNYTFYLSNEVAEAVIATAKKNKISNSKLVDNILKKVLLED